MLIFFSPEGRLKTPRTWGGEQLECLVTRSGRSRQDRWQFTQPDSSGRGGPSFLTSCRESEMLSPPESVSFSVREHISNNGHHWSWQPGDSGGNRQAHSAWTSKAQTWDLDGGRGVTKCPYGERRGWWGGLYLSLNDLPLSPHQFLLPHESDWQDPKQYAPLQGHMIFQCLSVVVRGAKPVEWERAHFPWQTLEDSSVSL